MSIVDFANKKRVLPNNKKNSEATVAEANRGHRALMSALLDVVRICLRQNIPLRGRDRD